MNASGFSKEIQEFDQALEEMKKEDQEAAEEQKEQESKGASGSLETSREGDDSKLSSDLEKLDLSQTGEPDPSNPAETDEAYDQFDINDLKLDNKGLRPFRDAGSSEEDSDQDDNYSATTTTSTIMDPQMVRSKVKKSILATMKKERRRIRNKGESALITERNREVTDTIKSSMNFF